MTSHKILFIILTLFFYEISGIKTSIRFNEEDGSFIEKEQPELSEESKRLISAYQRNPTIENYDKLRENVISNYNSVLVKKENKLEELKEETLGKPNGEAVVAEMNDIVQDMYITYWEHINFSMLRFTDKRFFQWKTSEAANYEFIPVMGAGDTVYIKRTPVTNQEYKVYLSEMNKVSPSNWNNGNYPSEEDDFPINYISYTDALDYCSWLTLKNGIDTYRMPSESEWELAAGHMPKDADFNAGNIKTSRVSVFEYESKTRGAHGAIDFWGNVWEWTSTKAKDSNNLKVKGGSWKSDRTDCRTENRKESRDPSLSYDDVGFRVIQILNGQEPTQKVELATLEIPNLTGKIEDNNNVILNWNKINEAKNYQVFEYDEINQIFKMLDLTEQNSITITNVENVDNKKYVVQAISYVEFSDNVSPEYAIKPTKTQNDQSDKTENRSKIIKIDYLVSFIYLCMLLLF